MPFYLQRDGKVWVGKLPGAAFGDMDVTGTNYLLARMSAPTVLLPKQEKQNDAGTPGNGHEFATFQCNLYWLPMSLQIEDTPNFDLLGRLLLRALSGAVTDTTVTGGVFKHAANQLPIASGLQMKFFNVVAELGGANSLHGGCVVNGFEMRQDAGASIPRVRADILSSGKHQLPHGIGTKQVETATAAGTATGNGNVNVTITADGLPGSPYLKVVAINNGDTASVWAGTVRTALAADPIIKYFFTVSGTTTSIVLTKRSTAPDDATLNIALANGTPSPGITAAPTSANTTAGAYTLPLTPSVVTCPGTKVEVKWTDPDGLRDFAQASGCPLRQWSVGISNNHTPTDDRCSTDPQQIEGDPSTTTGAGAAAYLTKLSRGDRTVTAQIVILMDSILPELPKYAQNQVLTDVTFSIVGPDIVAGFPSKLTLIIPQARIANIDEVDSNGKAALQIDLLPIFDSTSGGAIKGEVINNLDGASPDYN